MTLDELDELRQLRKELGSEKVFVFQPQGVPYFLECQAMGVVRIRSCKLLHDGRKVWLTDNTFEVSGANFVEGWMLKRKFMYAVEAARMWKEEAMQSRSMIGLGIGAALPPRPKGRGFRAGDTVMRIEKVDGCTFPGDKRQYLPFTVYDVCPKCGAEVKMDLTQDYMSYPEIGAPTDLDFYHECGEGNDAEWTRRVLVEFTMVEVKDA